METIDGVTFKTYGLKGHWKVLLSGYVIGFVAKEWGNLPYRRLMLNNQWSTKTYPTRIAATKDILNDLSNTRRLTSFRKN